MPKLPQQHSDATWPRIVSSGRRGWHMKSVLSTSEFTQHPALAVCQLVHSRAALYTWAPSFFAVSIALLLVMLWYLLSAASELYNCNKNNDSVMRPSYYKTAICIPLTSVRPSVLPVRAYITTGAEGYGLHICRISLRDTTSPFEVEILKDKDTRPPRARTKMSQNS